MLPVICVGTSIWICIREMGNMDTHAVSRYRYVYPFLVQNIREVKMQTVTGNDYLSVQYT